MQDTSFASNPRADCTPRHQPTVIIRDVVKSYVRGNTRTRVLDLVNLSVSQGESVFLLGPSGSGKTTLLSIIGCVLTPDDGDVVVLGNYLADSNDKARAVLRRKKIGFIFQRFHLMRGLSAAENVAVPLTLDGWRWPRALNRAVDMLKMVGLAEFADADPRRLSVGQCQRVAIARALATDPDLILADEPTASLDAATGQQAMQLLRSLTADVGKTMIVVTHDHRILPFADRIFQMENGRIREICGDAVEDQKRLPIPGISASTAGLCNADN